jgi:hypothetical protein
VPGLPHCMAGDHGEVVKKVQIARTTPSASLAPLTFGRRSGTHIGRVLAMLLKEVLAKSLHGRITIGHDGHTHLEAAAATHRLRVEVSM